MARNLKKITAVVHLFIIKYILKRKAIFSLVMLTPVPKT